jgi:hypothetical protein
MGVRGWEEKEGGWREGWRIRKNKDDENWRNWRWEDGKEEEEKE